MSSPAPRRQRILVVGAGFAGLATAFHLARSGAASVVVVDKEPIPGAHASGRNAALVLQSVAAPGFRRLTAASCAEYLRRSDDLGFAPTGSWLLGTRESLAAVREPARVLSRWRRPAEVLEALPWLAGHRFEAALETPGDGVMDISRLLYFYLEEARQRGVELRLGAEVTAIAPGSPAAAWRICAGGEWLHADVLVDAAGAWAPELAAMAGASPLPLTPFKRHLFVLDGVPDPLPAPFVWDLDTGFYLRRESAGLLFCVCDEGRSRSLEETIDGRIEAELAELVDAHLPALAAARPRRRWACFRTKAADGEAVIGWDPRQPGFFWVAALAGHGMGASWQIGRVAAAGLLAGSGADGAPWSPGRFGP